MDYKIIVGEQLSDEAMKEIFVSKEYTHEQKVNLLINNCIRLCIQIYGSFKSKDQQALSEALYGLVLAANTTDLTSDTVISYLAKSIRGAICNYFERNRRYDSRHTSLGEEIKNIKIISEDESYETVYERDFIQYIKKGLTKKERKVIDYKIRGWTGREIAKEMGYSFQNISSIINKIKSQLEWQLGRKL